MSRHLHKLSATNLNKAIQSENETQVDILTTLTKMCGIVSDIQQAREDS